MRCLVLPILLLLSSPAAAQQSSYGEIVEAQRRRQAARAADCAPSSAEDEIVVCGRDDGEDQRMGPAPPEEGAPERLIAGEVPRGTAALSIRNCTRMCPQPARIDPIEAFNTMRRVVGRLFDPDS